jgi:PKD repeat protein
MKNYRIIGTLVVCILCLSMGIASAQTQIRAPTVELLPEETATYSVDINGIENSTGVIFELEFNTTLVTITSAAANESMIQNLSLVTTENPTNWTFEIFKGDEELISVSDWTPILDVTFTATTTSGSDELGIQDADWYDAEFEDFPFDGVINGVTTVLEVEEEADLAITKTFESGTYAIGDLVPWTVTVTNNGPANATTITVVDDAAGLAGLNLTTLEVVASAGTFDAGNLTWSIPELLVGDTATLQINTSFDSDGDKTNNASITGADQPDPDMSNNAAGATVTIGAVVPEEEADLAITKTFAAGTYAIGDIVPWTVNLTNNGPANATNITAADDASGAPGLNFTTLEIVASVGTIDAENFTWSIPSLLVGDTATALVNTSFDSDGDKTNNISITGADQPDPDPSNNAAGATVTIGAVVPVDQADLAITKTFAQGTYAIGDIVPWTVNLTNNGPANATTITVTDDASGLAGLDPATLEVIAETGSFDAGNLTWSVPELLVNDTTTLLINTSFTTAGDKTNNVSITGADQDDPNPANNAAAATVTIQPLNLTANFTADITSGFAPLTVNFTDTSSGGTLVNWSWTFGVENATSSEQNPAFVYTDPGSYTVGLAVTDEFGNNATEVKTDYINVAAAPDDFIDLEPGWNFISTPKRLVPGSDTAAIFSDIDTAGRSILMYVPPGFWTPLGANDPIKVLDGIWIYSNESASVPLTYDTNPLVSPAIKELVKGWNTIGFSDIEPAPARTTMASVDASWSTIIGWNAGNQTYEVSIINGATDRYSDERPMSPMNGYWVFMKEDGILAALAA